MEFVRTTREGDKAFVIQINANDKGHYLEILEFRKRGQ
jgi:hypothetical protein